MGEILVPVSVGELLDKITILRIKQRKIKDGDKLRNINAELVALRNVCIAAHLDTEAPTVQELENVNLKLWQIEDDIREKERAKDFGADFVALARAVYVTNDERFKLKSQLNREFGSHFHEEKSYRSYT